MRKIIVLITLIAFPLCYAQEKIDYIDYEDILVKVSEHVQKDDFSEVLNELDKIHPNDSIYETTLILKSYYQLQQKKYDEVLKHVNQGISNSKFKSKYSFYVNKGVAYLRLKRYQEAIDLYDEVIKEFPKNHILFYNKAVAHEGLKEYDKAIESYKQSIILNPFYPKSHLQLGKLCFQEHKISLALMAFNMYLLLDPDSEESFSVLNAINVSVSKKNESIPLGIVLDENEDSYEDIDLILSNGLALSTEYKIKNKILIALTKQNHALLEQLKDFEDSTGFWAQKYVPFYQWIFNNGYFDDFTHTVSYSIQNETFKKIVEKNTSKIKDFIPLFYDKWMDIMKENEQVYQGEKQKVTHFFDEYTLEAIGLMKDDKAIGHWEIYDPKGRMTGKGEFDANGNRIGEWTWYTSEGEISDKENYKDGELEGKATSYYDTGIIKNELYYEQGKKQGVYKEYNVNGALIEKKMFVNNKLNGLYQSYHAIGASAIDYTVSYKEGKLDGELTRHYADSKLFNKANYKEGQITNVENTYYRDDQLKATYNYVDGLLNGVYKTYHPNGKVHEEGITLDGYYHGDWKVYYSDGILMKDMIYDKGKLIGLYKEYDIDGKLFKQFLYKKNEIIAYTYYDKKGAIIEENKKKNGEFYYKAYTPLGVIITEGLYDIRGGKKGKWKYYNDGAISSEGVYNDDKLQGEYINYYKTGKHKAISQYKNDSLTGYYIAHHKNGNMLEQGWYKNNQAHGQWNNYYANGSIKKENFFHKGNYHGLQKTYGVEGKLYKTITYEYGELISEEYYRSDETVLEEIVYNKPSKDSTSILKYLHYNDTTHSTTDLVYGVKHGNYVRFDFNGKKVVEGKYFNDQEHGIWTWYHANGEISIVGTYIHGKLQGEYNKYHENGKLESKSSYQYGKLNGVFYSYNEDEVLTRSTAYKEGNRHGFMKFFSPGGHLQIVRYYHNDKVIGYTYLDSNKELKATIPINNQTEVIKSYFDNGQVSASMEIKNGDFINAYKRYYYSGKIYKSTGYKNGDYQGKSIEYYTDGKVSTEMNYEDDELEGSYKKYYKNGTLKEEINYKSGTASGAAFYYNNEGKLIKQREFYNGLVEKEIRH